jgi:adiponectin receptor
MSPISILASLRILVLAALEDIETRIAQLEADYVDDPKAWMQDTQDMVGRIREDVISHLPDLHLEMTAVEDLIRHHLPEWADVRAHLPGLEDVRAGVRSRLLDVRAHIPSLDLPLGYLPTLSDHLDSLNSHLSSVQWPSTLVLQSLASKLLDKVLASDMFADLIESEENDLQEKKSARKTVMQIHRALKSSQDGKKLIHFDNLPDKWKNNEHVRTGYR